MKGPIPSIPEIPEELRLAAAEGRLVPFIGAGASRLGGCPSWDEFADILLKELVTKQVLNFSKFEQIRNWRLSPRIKLSLARSLAKKAGVKFDFDAAIHPSDQPLQNPLGRQLFGELSQLASVFVTTNYDRWLNKVLAPIPLQSSPAPAQSAPPPTSRARTVTFRVADINASLLAIENSVIHIHGSLSDPSTMIMTTSDYLQHYRISRPGSVELENNVVAFLRHLFAEKVVLFIGYGVDELEVLEYVTLKASQTPPVKTRFRHFILQPFFSHDIEVATHLETYYREELGVQLLPYLRDDNDYRQLINVISAFAKQLPANNPIRIQRRAELEALFDG